MARSISPMFQFQGTIDKLTYVNSLAYKPHVRAAKGTHTPNVLTDALAESSNRLQLCNQKAKPLFAALRDENRDTKLWPRLVSLYFKELKAGRKITVDCLRDLECNLTYKLDSLLPKGYNIAVKKEKKKLGISVRLQGHPKVEDKAPRVGYQLRLVVIYPDFVNNTVRKEVVTGPLTKYKSALKAVELEVPMPSAKTPFLVFMGVEPIVQGVEKMSIVQYMAMKVVAVG